MSMYKQLINREEKLALVGLGYVCLLYTSSLIGANLSNCIMLESSIQNAKLAFANLTGTNLSDAEFRTAYSLWNAILPDGKKYDGRFMLEGDIQEAKKLGYDIINDESQKKTFYQKRCV